MPNGSWKGRSVMFVGAILSLSACNGFGDVTETLNPSGPASLSSKGYAVTDLPLNPGQIGLFELAYAAALTDQQRIDRGDLAAATESSSSISLRARRMASEGVHLADSYCYLFFRYGSDNQKWLLVSKDLITIFGTIATGALALAKPGSATAAGITALSSGAPYNGVDIYTRNFLFGSDNIDAVRAMTMSVMASHSAKALPEVDGSIWTFGGAAEVINQHQATCLPASIRSLVLEAVKGGRFSAEPASGSQTSLRGSPTAATDAAMAQIPAATAAIARAVPQAAASAPQIANAAARAAGPAAASAAQTPGATRASIGEAARAAAAAGARDAAAAVTPNASRNAIRAIADAAASKVAAPAAAAAQATAVGGVPNRPPSTRQFNIRLRSEQL